MISRKHPNRRPYNWLCYDLSDRFLLKYKPFFKGVLYDLGAGVSPYREYLEECTDKYVAVDWGNSLHGGKPDVTADLNQPLPIESDSADTVFSLSVLEHLCEPSVMLGEAFRILKAGGGLVLNVPWQWWIHEAPYDYFRYTPYGLNYLLNKAGFTDIAVEPMGGFFTMLVLKLNYFSLRFILGPAPVQFLIRSILRIGWFVGQKCAPFLDHLDRNWQLETNAYYVTARKPLGRVGK